MQERPFTLDRTVRLVLTVAVFVAIFMVTKRLSGVLLPFVISWFIAYLIHPIVNFFQYKCKLKNRTFSVIVTLITLILVIGGVITAIIPLIRREITKMSAIVSNYMSGDNAESIIPQEWQDTFREWLSQIDYQSLVANGSVQSIVEKITPYITGFIGGSIDFVSGLFVVFVGFLYLVFILIDYEKITAGFVGIVPQKYRTVVSSIIEDVENGMNKYFRGQSLIALSVGVLFSIGFMITGLPLAIVIGLFIGLLNMVPYLQVAGIPVCMLLGILQSAYTGTSYWIVLLEIAVVFVVVQTIQDMLLTPLIMGNAIGMNPAVMLLSLSIWGSLLGVAGMIIALPMTSVIISYYKRYVLDETDNSPQQNRKIHKTEN